MGVQWLKGIHARATAQDMRAESHDLAVVIICRVRNVFSGRADGPARGPPSALTARLVVVATRRAGGRRRGQTVDVAMLATHAKHGAAAHARAASRAACPCWSFQGIPIVNQQALVNLRKARCRYQLKHVRDVRAHQQLPSRCAPTTSSQQRNSIVTAWRDSLPSLL